MHGEAGVAGGGGRRRYVLVLVLRVFVLERIVNESSAVRCWC